MPQRSRTNIQERSTLADSGAAGGGALSEQRSSLPQVAVQGEESQALSRRARCLGRLASMRRIYCQAKLQEAHGAETTRSCGSTSSDRSVEAETHKNETVRNRFGTHRAG